MRHTSLEHCSLWSPSQAMRLQQILAAHSEVSLSCLFNVRYNREPAGVLHRALLQFVEACL